jgi:hypothetical protein
VRLKPAAWIAAAATGFSALPALAGTYVFDVTVTGIAPFDSAYYGFAPTRAETATLPQTFQVSITTSGGYGSEIFLPGDGGEGHTNTSFPTTPLTPELYALSAIDPSTLAGYLGMLRGGPNFYNSQDTADFNYVAYTYATAADGEIFETDYGLEIYGAVQGSGVDYLDPYNDQETAGLLQRIGTFSFTEYADNQHYDSDGNLVTYDLASYTGTAVFRTDLSTPAPEPAQWVLMISGFGLAGAALRRRRSQALA